MPGNNSDERIYGISEWSGPAAGPGTACSGPHPEPYRGIATGVPFRYHRAMLDRFTENFVIVLNEPQDLVNIAGTARAMMNTGLRRLRLVNPAEYDEWRITGIAHGGEVVLERTERCDSLEAALADAGHVVGTTARRRAAPHIWQHPREAARPLLRLAAEPEPAGPVVIVFGREDAGLSNENLDLCDRVLTVPTDPRRPSLNLAQAVLLVG